MNGHVHIRGAAEHNLRSVDLDLPHRQLVAISGVSGSGKTSLVYDVVYAEARRRFLAALEGGHTASWQRLRPPRVARLDGLAPALALQQGGGRAHPRSTVATLAGLYDGVRLLFARLGQPHCMACGAAVQAHRFEEVYETALGFAEGTRLLVLAPLRIEAHCAGSDVIEEIDRSGYRRLRLDGEERLLEEVDAAELQPGQRMEIVVDRLVVKPEAVRRLRGSLQAALELSAGQVVLARKGVDDDLFFAVEPACAGCGAAFAAIDLSLFSFNSAQGACPTCRGLGQQVGMSMERVLGGLTLSLDEAVGRLWHDFGHGGLREKVGAFCQRHGVEEDAPVGEWDGAVVQRLWDGHRGRGAFVGLRRSLEQVAARAKGDELAWFEERFSDVECAACCGTRLRPEALAVEVDGLNIGQLCALPIGEALRFVEGLRVADERAQVGAEISRHLLGRLHALDALGVGYLQLDRSASSLSNGEQQRLRLGAALESGMTQMLYVLDEPSAGLHASDAERLIAALEALRDAGNTVLVIEHDRALLERADWLVDMGPGAGERGGEVVASGAPRDVAQGASLTARHLRGALRLDAAVERPLAPRGWLRLYGVRGHNLAIDEAAFPLGNLVGVSGLSGSGKSSLVDETLYPLLAAQLHASRRRPLAYDRCEGADAIERIIAIDQNPIGRTPRSNAATYTGLFAPIRRLFAELPVARMRAYGAAHFSFNASQGACDSCGGSGVHALGESLWGALESACGTCDGRRYRGEVLDVRFRERHIADVLEMSVEEAHAFFEAVPEVARRLAVLCDVGLGYLRLGQAAPSFSGGEAQRVKLAAELGRSRQGGTLYILDEPTTGLHLEDVRLLMRLLQRLVDEGNSVLVVEHHVELLAAVDWLIDLGPGAGDDGGRIVAEGAPRAVADVEASLTGRYLRAHFAEVD